MKYKGCARCGGSMVGRPLAKFSLCKKCTEYMDRHYPKIDIKTNGNSK